MYMFNPLVYNRKSMKNRSPPITQVRACQRTVLPRRGKNNALLDEGVI